MIGKIKSRKDGYLLVEILISMSIFSVLVFVISVFLKRIVIVEKAKKNNQKMYEKMYFSMDKIVLDIKNRDIRKFSYEKKKIEYEKGKLFVSDAENLGKFGSKVEIGKFDEAKFEKVGELLIIRLKENKNEDVRVVKI